VFTRISTDRAMQREIANARLAGLTAALAAAARARYFLKNS